MYSLCLVSLYPKKAVKVDGGGETVGGVSNYRLSGSYEQVYRTESATEHMNGCMRIVAN